MQRSSYLPFDSSFVYPEDGSAPQLRAPSERDMEIYKRVKVQKHLQWEVAQERGLHYSRVSQIIKQVERWLIAGGDPIDPEIRDHVARQRLSRATNKLRLVRACEIATLAMELPHPPHQTIRRRIVGSTEVWREETLRDQPAYDLAAVRLVIRATEALQKLEEQEQHGKDAEPLPEQELLPAVFEMLCTWRTRAEADGRLTAGADVRSLVGGLLDGLLGTHFAREKEQDPSGDQAAHDPLNLSAGAEESQSTNGDEQEPYDDSSRADTEQNRELERSLDDGGEAPSDMHPLAGESSSPADQPPPNHDPQSALTTAPSRRPCKWRRERGGRSNARGREFVPQPAVKPGHTTIDAQRLPPEPTGRSPATKPGHVYSASESLAAAPSSAG
jgi:hypothetical protein